MRKLKLRKTVSKMLLNEEYMKRELFGKKLLVDDEFIAEVKTLFMERLSADEELGKIIRESDVDLDGVLSTYVDCSSYRSGGSVTVMSELTRYFLKSDTVSVHGITVTINNYSMTKDVNAVCKVDFTTRLVFPKEFRLEGSTEFGYENEWGTPSKNELCAFSNGQRKLKARFKISTPTEVVDVLFGVMHNLLKEGTK